MSLIELCGPFEFDGKRIEVQGEPPEWRVAILRPMRVWLEAARDHDPLEPIPTSVARFYRTPRITRDKMARIYEYRP